ncbi:MAG: hypothetical protein ABWZ26_07185 [Candidatus Nanopelagicales bacterium]
MRAVTVDVLLETGRRKVFASAVGWPGWSRSGKNEEAALAVLEDYLDRYAPVVTHAGLRVPQRTAFKVVERLKGGGATDFGIPGAVAEADARPWSVKEATRQADIMVAAWAYLEDVIARASATLRKGPRGGGRDRDQIDAHVAESEIGYARALGIKAPDSSATRVALERAVRSSRGGPAQREKGWPMAYAVRRIVWHVLDHAWEIQDKSA